MCIRDRHPGGGSVDVLVGVVDDLKHVGQSILKSISLHVCLLYTSHTGSVIPLDGRVLEGEASVNQASLTGEAEPVRKSTGAVVYALSLIHI